jgi:protein-S-isoprenylcysteine O-methyltransferase Ste14
MIAIRSILHNLLVTAVGFIVAFIGAGLDRLFGIDEFRSTLSTAAGSLLIAIGFLIRFWATFYFYKNRMRVIVTVPQATLLTSGPYRYSRNPLYLGGNVLIFFGASLVLGSPMAVAITALHLPFVDLFIRQEERQLEQRFGEDWLRYKRSVRRWI